MQGTVVGVTSRISPPLENIELGPLISVFVDVACYAKWIQDQCQKLDKQTKCTFNADPKPKEEICPDPNTDPTPDPNPSTGGTVSPNTDRRGRKYFRPPRTDPTLDPNPSTTGTASHLKSSVITSLAYALFVIAKMTSSFD